MTAEPTSQTPDDAPRGIYGPDGQPQFFQDPAVDRFVAVVLKLSQELWVLNERVDMLERLSSMGRPFLKENIDSLINDRELTVARDAQLKDFLHRVLGQLREPK